MCEDGEGNWGGLCEDCIGGSAFGGGGFPQGRPWGEGAPSAFFFSFPSYFVALVKGMGHPKRFVLFCVPAVFLAFEVSGGEAKYFF